LVKTSTGNMPPNADTHERMTTDETIKGSSDRSFGLVIATALAIFGLWPVVFGSSGPRWWLLVPAALFLAVALIRSSLLRHLNRAWTKLGLIMHHIVNPVVLGSIYFLVVTPIGLLMRALGKRPLRLRLDRATPSYWITREPPGPEGASMKNQF